MNKSAFKFCMALIASGSTGYAMGIDAIAMAIFSALFCALFSYMFFGPGFVSSRSSPKK